MNKLKYLLLFLFASQYNDAQIVTLDSLNLDVDNKYREDQFYVGATYSLVDSNDLDISQTGFSSSLQFGFIRDFPFNENRTLAFGIGLGYSVNSINQNLKISENSENNYNYELLSAEEFSKNKLITHFIELPLEFRWRASTPESYKFWRIYSGIKVGYLMASSSKFKGISGASKINRIKDLHSFQYGLTLSVGYSKMNLHLYYALHPIFKKEALVNELAIDVKLIKLGLIIYIL